jgi:hypothetical protein
MNARQFNKAARASFACTSLGVLLALSGCASDSYGGGGVSTSVSYGYGGYYDPYYGGGYYDPYPPVVIDRPDERPDRPNGGNRPTTLPSEVGGASAKPSVAPSRPSTSSRPTSRPSPRPAPRPMPRGGGGMRR